MCVNFAFEERRAIHVFNAMLAVNVSKEPRVARFEGEFGCQVCERARSPHWHVLKAFFYVSFASSARVAHFECVFGRKFCEKDARCTFRDRLRASTVPRETRVARFESHFRV